MFPGTTVHSVVEHVLQTCKDSIVEKGENEKGTEERRGMVSTLLSLRSRIFLVNSCQKRDFSVLSSRQLTHMTKTI